jgi:TIGR00252 family protein
LSINNRKLGSKWEHAAADYLKKSGYEILETNFRCRIGEIDIIAKAEDTLCFIEVKYRKTSRYGFAALAVTQAKQQIIRRVAQYYLYTHNIADTQCRFDVVAFDAGNPQIIKNAF